jgi:hypothetical protein
MTRLFLREDVDEVKLEQCLTDQEGQQIRFYLSKHAQPVSERAQFADHNVLRTISQVLIKAVDREMPLALVANAIDQQVGKKTIADKLRARMNVVDFTDDIQQPSSHSSKKARVADVTASALRETIVVQITLDVDFDQFDSHEFTSRLCIAAQVDAADVKVLKTYRGSTIVILQIIGDGAESLRS